MRVIQTFSLIASILGSLVLCQPAPAATKVHVVAFGKWTPVQCLAGYGANEKPLSIKVRALIVDGRTREYVFGSLHEVTDRLFVVRRAFRVNDSLPDDSAPRWQWQRGGWLLVDRTTGHISPITLPEFDGVYSAGSWYRDYVAYCGVADDGKKTYAIVSQLSRKKPVLRKQIAEGLPEDAPPDSACPVPEWERDPVRVSFSSAGNKQTFAVRGRVVDLVDDADDEE
jgi:hypothetical protein